MHTEPQSRLRRPARITAALLLALHVFGATASAAGPGPGGCHGHAQPASADAQPSHEQHAHSTVDPKPSPDAHRSHAASHDHGHAHAASHDGKHPTPRAEARPERIVDPALVARSDKKETAPVYAMVREIPQVIDGIYCYCECARGHGHYSLFSCFEDGHGAWCGTCLQEVELAHRLHKEGKTLDQIRAAIDAQFGRPATPAPAAAPTTR